MERLATTRIPEIWEFSQRTKRLTFPFHTYMNTTIFSLPRKRSSLSSEGRYKFRDMRDTMIQLNLTDDEASILKQALATYLSDLRMEIADTDQQEFRDRLKQEEVVVKTILGTLPE